jgi:hypothetical protein
MTNLERFQAYANAFEKVLINQEWHSLKEYFTPDATYDPGDGSKAVGRDQVIATLSDSVNGLDRRFDARTLTTTQPTVAGETVSFSWQITFAKASAPDLVLSGVEHATFSAGAISKMVDVFDDGVVDSLAAWMAAHGDLLAP